MMAPSSIAQRCASICRIDLKALGRARSTARCLSSFGTTRSFKENDMVHHDIDHGVRCQQWSTFHGKIPVLQHGYESYYQGNRPEHPFRHSESDFAVDTNHNRKSQHALTDQPTVSVLMELDDGVGMLHNVLKYFWKHDVNISRIESRPAHIDEDGACKFDFFIDFHGSFQDANIQQLMREIRPIATKLLTLDQKDVAWFPRHISELDLIAHRTLDVGIDLQSDHPGFTDEEYRHRRNELAQHAMEHAWDKKIEHVEYTAGEIDTWATVWTEMEPLWDQYACREFKESMAVMKENCGYSRDNIPQSQDINDFLRDRTGFRVRPVAGLLSSRDFLNGLAFRVFFSTQYIRHHSQPMYTPEPDICHELLGHAPMFANTDFADFSQEIGLASLGASEEDIQKLARCYWHSVEFGLCREDGNAKAYGAGLLSSFGEIKHACSGHVPDNDDSAQEVPQMVDWDPAAAAAQDFPVTTFQPVYFVAQSLADAKQKMRRYCEVLPRPFCALHNAKTDSIYIDRPVRRANNE
eukprot:CAMPEP_0198111014 /NCGR_PEP_ID=MMETSP1442-20131203/2997_1 /TAXON_ID= /ORGANISM="Craspedostauros australis, Strain CCMP3328" /LENGTH=522 /DNA_ID=CAMNT_0043767291 /DNA_START=318 /DNA_END=1886 /DNA_ORIENTATION=-